MSSVASSQWELIKTHKVKGSESFQAGEPEMLTRATGPGPRL